MKRVNHESIMKTGKFKFFAVSLIIGLGIFLRVWQYPFYPFAGHAEEYLFVWSGLSLIEEGVPISWNDLPVYEEKDVYWRGVAPNPSGSSGLGVRLLKPWLDEPPLFSLIVGGMAKLYNQSNFTVISPYIIRLPSIFFTFISLVLIFLVSNKLFSYKIGLLSTLIYATIPTVVFGSRLAVPENMITTLILASVFFVLHFQEKKQTWILFLLFFLALLAGLAKPTGILIVPLIVFFLWRQKHFLHGLIGGIITVSVYTFLFFLYGFYYNKELFLKVVSYQGLRPTGWSGLAYLLTNPGFSIEIFLDGFVVLGFVALVFLLFKKRDESEDIILFVFLYTILIVLFTGGKHDQLAWYRYPIYPFMSISMALFFKEIILKPNFYSAVIFIPLILANTDLLENPFFKYKFFIEPGFFRIFFLILILPFFIRLFFESKFWLTASKIILIIVIFFSFMINIWVIRGRFGLLCDNTTCPLPQRIDLLFPFKQ